MPATRRSLICTGKEILMPYRKRIVNTELCCGMWHIIFCSITWTAKSARTTPILEYGILSLAPDRQHFGPLLCKSCGALPLIVIGQIPAKKRIPSQLTISIEDLRDSISHGASVEETYDAKVIGSLITKFIKSLDDRQRYIFMDRYYMAEPVEKPLRI